VVFHDVPGSRLADPVAPGAPGEPDHLHPPIVSDTMIWVSHDPA
jgi:hypothetical protein